MHHVNGLGQPLFKLPLAQGRRHACNQLPPLSMLDMDVQSSVGHDFDGTLCKQKVDQHPIVALSIPDAQLAEHHQGAFSRGCMAAQIAPWQTSLDAESNLSAMRLLATGDSFLETLQRGI